MNIVFTSPLVLFLDPGGSEVLMEFAGADGTTMFEDVGHSSEARSTMEQYSIGSVKVRRA